MLASINSQHPVRVDYPHVRYDYVWIPWEPSIMWTLSTSP